MIKEIISIYKRREKAHNELLKCDLEIDKILKQHHKALEKQKEDIGKEFKKWFHSKKKEDIIEAIERITNVKV